MERPLDRPVWSALTTSQAELSIGGTEARRYRPEINLFAASVDGGTSGLSRLLSPGEQIGTVEPVHLRAGLGLSPLRTAVVDQMIAERCLPPFDDREVVTLGASDAAEMRSLATLCEPGPFFAETWRMGLFLGVRDRGRLIAMAGQRMRVPGYVEVSAVCTHPDHRGRGLAGELMRMVACRIIGAGDTAFLHVYPHNKGAIALYEALGFLCRRQLHFQTWARA